MLLAVAVKMLKFIAFNNLFKYLNYCGWQLQPRDYNPFMLNLHGTLNDKNSSKFYFSYLEKSQILS